MHTPGAEDKALDSQGRRLQGLWIPCDPLRYPSEVTSAQVPDASVDVDVPVG